MHKRPFAAARLAAVWLLLGVAAAQACHLNAPLEATEYHGVVVGPAPADEVTRQTLIAIARTGGPPTQRYAAMPRILVDFRDEAGVTHRTISAVTDGQIPPPGALVTVLSRHLDPADACHFIPWTVVYSGPTT